MQRLENSRLGQLMQQSHGSLLKSPFQRLRLRDISSIKLVTLRGAKAAEPKFHSLKSCKICLCERQADTVKFQFRLTGDCA